MAVIDNRYSLRAGVLADLKDTWTAQASVFKKQQELLVKFLPYNNLRKATYAWKESIPFPARWDFGMGRTYQTFKDNYIQISNTAYELSIAYNRFDKDDDQIGDVKEHVQLAVRRFLQLPDKFVAEYINNAANLLPNINNAYDGVALFSDVDGDGSNRFSTSGGNIITGTGSGTTAALKNDLMVAQRRFLTFKDTAGQPIFNEEDVALERLHTIVPNDLNAVIQDLAGGEYIRTDLGSNTAQSNITKGRFKYHLNPYLTDTADWYVAVEHPYWKPFAFRAPNTPNQIIAEFANSDHAREYNEEVLYADVRAGLGVWCPFCFIKVNN